LRKRFCRQFNFELQAAATEDAIVLSLGPTHSFPLDDVFHYLNSKTVRELLCQALLDAPMWNIRWRWNVTRALAVLRRHGGKKIPAQLQRMNAEDLLTAVFPDQVACAENLTGQREIPEHPLVSQTVRDCLEEAMDVDSLEALLASIERNEKNLFARDLLEPSPLAAEILNARPYAYLDDAPLEERRTRAVSQRRWLDPATAADIGKLDQAAIDRVRSEAWPQAQNPDELHDALVELGFITEAEGMLGEFAVNEAAGQHSGSNEADQAEETPDWTEFLRALSGDRRAAVFHAGSAGVSAAALMLNLTENKEVELPERQNLSSPEGGDLHDDRSINEGPHSAGATPAIAAGRETLPVTRLWVAAERLPQLQAVFPNSILQPLIAAPASLIETAWSFDDALVELLRGRLEGLGPVTAMGLATSAGLAVIDVDRALLKLEAEGFVLRGRFTPGTEETEWCARRLLARIHRYTLNRLRQEIEPVSSADFIRFLLAWQKVAPDHQMEGPQSLLALIEQLEGFEAPAAAWEGEIFPSRLVEYDPAWLDALCLSGEVVWARLTPGVPSKNGAEKSRSGPVRSTPIALLRRKDFSVWNSVFPRPVIEEMTFSTVTQDVYDYLKTRGASFFSDIVEGTKLLRSQVEESLADLVSSGLVVSDSFTGLRALLTPSHRKTQAAARRKRREAVYEMSSAGRWSIINRMSEPQVVTTGSGIGSTPAPEALDKVARLLLKRYGVVFKRLLEREGITVPWRVLLRIYHRLEARGEIRGGRFVAGISGEQFALPEAVGMMRAIRRAPANDNMISVSAADPLNLVGIITPGPRISAHTSNRVLYSDGIPLAVLESSNTRFLVELSRAMEWKAKAALLRKATPPILRSYLSRPA
jgi:ATP-dependent Lhr-like helicase